MLRGKPEFPFKCLPFFGGVYGFLNTRKAWKLGIPCCWIKRLFETCRQLGSRQLGSLKLAKIIGVQVVWTPFKRKGSSDHTTSDTRETKNELLVEKSSNASKAFGRLSCFRANDISCWPVMTTAFLKSTEVVQLAPQRSRLSNLQFLEK